MPELPEVQTTVNGLKKKAVGLAISDVWTDLAKHTYTTPHLSQSIKDKKFFATFRKKIRNRKIISVERRAKNILIHLSGGHTILIHMKMTGHLMIGKYVFDTKKKMWSPDPSEKNNALRDPYNKFLHVVFSLSNGKCLVLSDARKFAKVTLVETSNMENTVHLAHLGPEPLDKKFTKEVMLASLMRRPNGKIKQILMDQSVIAGIGNIYSDEMLWLTSVHPLSVVSQIPKLKLNRLYLAMHEVLSKGIHFGGDSTSDYRNIDGKPGTFHHTHNVYQQKNKKCKKSGCNGIISRIVVGGRSAHFCPQHQEKY